MNLEEKEISFFLMKITILTQNIVFTVVRAHKGETTSSKRSLSSDFTENKGLLRKDNNIVHKTAAFHNEMHEAFHEYILQIVNVLHCLYENFYI